MTLRTITVIDNTYTGWPVVLDTDWCGCYTARTRPRKTKEGT